MEHNTHTCTHKLMRFDGKTCYINNVRIAHLSTKLQAVTHTHI